MYIFVAELGVVVCLTLLRRHICILILLLYAVYLILRCVFDRYDELASKSNVEYIAGGNVSYNMYMQYCCP